MLGRSYRQWEALHEHCSTEFPPLTRNWKFSGPKFGWSLRLVQKKRTVVYLIPAERRFLAGIVLGERALEVARRQSLPTAVIEVIDAAKKYAEGTGFRVSVRTREDRESVEQLLAAKMSR